MTTNITSRATDAPTEKILDRKPVPKSASLFTITMWKMILGQAVYQLAVTFMLFFAGNKLFGSHLGTKDPQLVLGTIVFNTFVWMQIFNEFNNRRLDNNFNIFEGMFRNYWFLGINCIMVGGQILIVYVGGAAFGVTPLGGLQWGVCIICAVCCLPWAVVLRTIPDKQFGIVFNFVVTCMRFLLRPILRGFDFLIRRFKRLSQRNRREMSENVQSHDEELALTDVKRQPSPPDIPVTPPVSVPPITITTS